MKETHWYGNAPRERGSPSGLWFNICDLLLLNDKGRSFQLKMIRDSHMYVAFTLLIDYTLTPAATV